jgi:two-component SAPR family response regulator
VLLTLGLQDNLIYKAGNYVFYTKEIWTDIEQFERDTKIIDVPVQKHVSVIEHALTLYRGSLLGNRDYLWCSDRRQFLYWQFVKASLQLARFYIENRQYDRAEKRLVHTLQFSPDTEEAHELLLQCCLLRDDRGSFIRHFLHYKNMLKNELGIPPKKEWQDQYEELTNKQT